jgi:hypothetical protein
LIYLFKSQSFLYQFVALVDTLIRKQMIALL